MGHNEHLEVSDQVGSFDWFATGASNVSTEPVFFALCVALVEERGSSTHNAAATNGSSNGRKVDA
jgi:hypothetical protein